MQLNNICLGFFKLRSHLALFSKPSSTFVRKRRSLNLAQTYFQSKAGEKHPSVNRLVRNQNSFKDALLKGFPKDEGTSNIGKARR